MRSPIHLLSLSALLLSALTPASAEGPPSSNSARTQKVYLHQWPLSASTPTPLATITYNQLSGHASFASFSPPPPPPPSSDEIIRIGLLQKDGEWVGTVTDQKSLADREKVEVTLWVDEVKGDVWRVEFLHNYNASVCLSLSLSLFSAPLFFFFG